METKSTIGIWFVFWTVVGSLVGIANGFSTVENFQYVNFSIVHVAMFFATVVLFFVGLQPGLPSDNAKRSREINRKYVQRFGMSMCWTIIWFGATLCAFFGAYPYFPILNSLTPESSINWPEERFKTYQCDIR